MLEPTMENRTYGPAETEYQNTLSGEVRTDWVLDEVRSLFDLPFNDLLFKLKISTEFGSILIRCK